MAHDPNGVADQQLFTVDAATEEDRRRQVDQNAIAVSGYERRFTEADAIRIANFGRAYLNGSPEIAAAIAETQLEWDMPAMRELMTEDAKQQDSVWSTVNKGLRATSRTAVAALGSVWDEGLGRLTRSSILGYQGHGDSQYENWQRAGSSYLGQATRDMALGRPVRMGGGWLPGPTPIHKYEGFSGQFMENLEAQGFDPTQGIPTDAFQTAYQQTEGEFVDQYGYSTVQRAWDSQEATIISSTRNGRTYATPFSFGRAPALQVSTPGTIPFNLLSGFTDATLQVAWDPLNVPAWKIHQAIKSRKLFQPLDPGKFAPLTPGDLDLMVPPSAGVPDTSTAAVIERVATGQTTPVTKAPKASGTTWDMGDDVAELRRVQDELDDLHDDLWGPPGDAEIEATENGIPFIRKSEDLIDEQVERLLVQQEAFIEKLATGGIYLTSDTISPTLLDELVDATKGAQYIEFTDLQARGIYGITEDVGPAAEGFVFHGGSRQYDPGESFQGGISLRADRAAGYAGWEDGVGYVQVYNKADLPETVLAHLDNVGDVERAIHLPGADPGLMRQIDEITDTIEPLLTKAEDLQNTIYDSIIFKDPLEPGSEFATPALTRQAAQRELLKVRSEIAEIRRGERVMLNKAAGVDEDAAKRIVELEDRIKEAFDDIEAAEHDFNYWAGTDPEEVYVNIDAWEIELEAIRPSGMKRISGHLEAGTVLTPDALPQPVAVYPVADFQQALKSGKLKVPGPEIHVPDVPPPPVQGPIQGPPRPPAPTPPVTTSPTPSQVGIVDSWRPYSKPITVGTWLREGSGTRLIDYLTQANLSRVTEILGDLPIDAQRAIAGADNAADVIEILGPHLGVTIAQKPAIPKAFGRKILGATFYGDNVASNAVSRVSESPVGRTYRMLGDTTDILELNPQDASRTMSAVLRRLQGWGVDPDKIEDIMWMVANADGSTGKMHEAAGAIADLFEDRLLTKRVFGQQYDPIDVKIIMQTFLDDTATARRYNDNLSGNPINPEGSRTWRHETQTGATVELPLDNAHLDSEFAHSSIFLPSGKETRRALAAMRLITDQFRRGAAAGVKGYKDADAPLSGTLKYIDGTPPGLSKTRGQIVLDAYLAGWRNLQLIRLGWVLRYLPDEALRYVASGEMTGPASYFIYGMQHGHLNLLGDNLDDILQAQGLGAASFIHRFDDTVAGARFDASRTTWSMVRWGDPGAARGLAHDAVQVNKSLLAQMVLDRGLEDAYTFLQTRKSKELLRPIVRDAAKNSRLNRMLAEPDILYDVLAEAEQRIAKVAGSQKWLYRNTDDGIWRDAFGIEIDDYTDAEKWPNMQSLRDEATRRELLGRSKPQSREEMRNFLLEDDGHGMLANPDPRRNFFTLDGGSPRARQFLRDGLDEQGNAVIAEQMGKREWTILEETYPNYIEGGGYQPPPMQKVPSIKQANRLAEYSDRFTDFAFRVLGQTPTVKLIRSPYAKTVYANELSRMYLFGDQATRGRLIKWADEVDESVIGFRQEFDTMIKNQLRDRNMKNLPKGTASLKVDDMDMIARSIAVESSRELFYDLSKTHNWADLSRVIWPFADAWWEVISRWAGLLNPAKNGGKALLNFRRAQQGAMGAKRSGWFEEDAYGNEVFSWFPQFGTALPFLQPDTGSELTQIENQVQPSNLLFVDPSDPGSFMKPGFGPPAQILGALVEPLLPVQVRDEFRGFLYGDFAPPDFSEGGLAGIAGELAEVHAPTWIRRLAEAWNTESKRTDTSTLTVKLYEALVLSGDPRFQVFDRDSSTTVMEHAQAVSGRLNWARFLDGLLGPSQQYEAEFWATINNTKDPGFWMNTRAVGEELRAAEEWLGTEEAAIEYILERYGFNPLDTGPSTAFIRDFPVGKDGYQYLQENPEIGEYFPNTMMAWIPEADDVDFYRPAWDASKEFGARIDVTVGNAPSIRSATKGNYLYGELQREHEMMLQQAAVRWPTSSAKYQAYANQADEWFGLETLQLGTEFGPYWAWGFDRNIGEEGINKPTPRDLMDELARAGGYRLVVTDENAVVITEQPTAASAYAAELNPEFYGFVRYMMGRWQEAEASSAAMGFRTRWWRSSEAQDDSRPEAIRQWYVTGLETYTAGLSERNKLGAQYIAERVITPLMAGYEWDEPLIIYNEPPAPPGVTTDDTLQSQDLIGAPSG